jgi:membrane associated rhomboid family serine protease
MTIIIIGITVLVSIAAFNNRQLFDGFQFNAYRIYHHKEWYRLLTHGFLHANYTHLIVNMLVLFMFGTAAERWLQLLESDGIIKYYRLVFVLFYVIAVVLASLTSLFRHKDDAWYNAVGASGAVSAVLFFNIFFNPWEKLYVYALIPVPGIMLGAAYLIYSHFMSRKEIDNINHDAHLLGAVFGFVFPLFLDVRLINHFIHELLRM